MKVLFDVKSYTYTTIEQLVKKYPDNEFLKISLQLTQKNYAAGEELSNKILLNEAWSEKYGTADRQDLNSES